MDADAAKAYAKEIVEEYAGPGANIFTNAQWDQDKLSGWSPVTTATFDVLVLITSGDFAVGVLVEDED